ncbi:MAG: hypothetical protein IPN76_09445 [Saprospiraceae bacterium]|nr:hypothetical protein [Saprospiraceae bacterium]
MNQDAASVFLNNVIGYKEIAKTLEGDKYNLANKIHLKTSWALRKIEPSKCLSFQLYRGDVYVKEVKLSASIDYVRVLIAYMKEVKFEGYTIESCVTPIALKATEEAIVEFYSDEEIRGKITEGVTNQIRNSKIIKGLIQKDISTNQAWLKHEVKTLLAGESASSLAGDLINTMSNSISQFLSSTVGQQLLAAIGKFMATGMGKLLLKQISVVVAKALAAGVFKSAILLAIKKIGVGILIKTVVGKAILALLALIGISGIPIAWIIIPIIAGILVYEYNSFPEKLADKIPKSIASNIRNNFEELNNTVVQEIVKVISNELVNQLTKVEK